MRKVRIAGFTATRIRLAITATAAALVVSALTLATGSAAPANAHVGDEGVVIKLATVAPDGSPWAAGLQEFKKLVETEAKGKVKVKLFLGGTLGDENETMLATKRGQIQAFGGSTGAISSQVPEMAVFELPYLFRTAEEADYVFDNVVNNDVAKFYTDRGLVLGFWSENGFRSFGGKFAINTVDDLKGRKMRSQESNIHLAYYRALGASPVPIPTTEALTSLQTGVVDGYDQTPLFTFASSLHTASKFMSISDHIYQPAAIVFNKAAYDTWPKEVQVALSNAAAKVTAKLRKQIRAMNPILLDNLKKAGITVNVLTEAQRAPFIKVAEKVRTEYVAGATPAEKKLYANIDAGLKAYRAGKR